MRRSAAPVYSLPHLIVAAEGLRTANFLAEVTGDNLLAMDGTETREQVDEITQRLADDCYLVSTSIKRVTAAIEAIYPGFTSMVEQFDPP